ncbi:glycosyl hydrolase family 28-related protein [Lutibacter citreus]|uniref:glycosyl hydrolase family 28-related protein n=1 Tax=Lutibacter citreus TaxID=2138210 RepID=UPI000DBE0D36|nr:glycosyl hydrolase family 28-related protein [Lutibacter citreus]
MISKISKLIGLPMFFLFFLTANAQYVETMNPKGIQVDLKKDYGLKNDNAATPQGYKLQKAIDEISSRKNGGNIYIPKGIYDISEIVLKSNVHLLIEAGTILKLGRDSQMGAQIPRGPKGQTREIVNTKGEVIQKKDIITGVFFKLDSEKGGTDYIENVSIRGINGAFTVDYHNLKSRDRQRVIVASMVKNFLIQDMIVKDNYTVFCGITLAPSGEKKKDVKGWEVSRATNGTLRNISHYQASPGYGLVQCHGAQNIHFENLYAEGGVSLRLEVGADNKNVGVYDLTAENIINKNGRCALMMGPHSAKNGIVTIKNVTSISSTFAVKVGKSHVKKNAPDQTPGYFHNDSSITNVRAIYGTNAQVKGMAIPSYPNAEAYFDSFKIFSDYKFFEGPSIGAVEYYPTTFSLKIKNVTMEGFPYNNDKPIMHHEDIRNINWSAEKKTWEDAHTSKEFLSDKGVLANDYKAEAYNFKKK